MHHSIHRPIETTELDRRCDPEWYRNRTRDEWWMKEFILRFISLKSWIDLRNWPGDDIGPGTIKYKTKNMGTKWRVCPVWKNCPTFWLLLSLLTNLSHLSHGAGIWCPDVQLLDDSLAGCCWSIESGNERVVVWTIFDYLYSICYCHSLSRANILALICLFLH